MTSSDMSDGMGTLTSQVSLCSEVVGVEVWLLLVSSECVGNRPRVMSVSQDSVLEGEVDIGDPISHCCRRDSCTSSSLFWFS